MTAAGRLPLPRCGSPADGGSMAFSGDRAQRARRKAVDATATPHAPRQGSGDRAPARSPAPLPRGERGEREGEHPRPCAKRAALDRHASYASEVPLAGEHRKRRHALRFAAGRIVPHERVARCGQEPPPARSSPCIVGTGMHISAASKRVAPCGPARSAPLASRRAGGKSWKPCCGLMAKLAGRPTWRPSPFHTPASSGAGICCGP